MGRKGGWREWRFCRVRRDSPHSPPPAVAAPSSLAPGPLIQAARAAPPSPHRRPGFRPFASPHAMAHKRPREEACATCGHVHDVSERGGEEQAGRVASAVNRAISTPSLLLPLLPQYEGGEPCSICGHTLSPAVAAPPRAAARPGAMPGGRVFFGSYANAARCDLLKGMGVTHVVNVRARGRRGGGAVHVSCVRPPHPSSSLRPCPPATSCTATPSPTSPYPRPLPTWARRPTRSRPRSRRRRPLSSSFSA